MANNRLKILHVLWESYPLPGGSCVRSKYIVDYQRKYCEPMVLTSPFCYDMEQLRLGVRHISDGVPYFHSLNSAYLIHTKVRSSPGIGVLVRKWHMRKFERFIDRIVEETCPDIIHAISPFSVGLPAFNIARKYSIPFVYEVRAFAEDCRAALGKIKEGGLRHQWNRHAETELMRQANAVITLCEAMRKDILMRGISRAKVFVVPNGVDLNLFTYGPKDKEIVDKLNLEGYVVLGMTSIKPLEGADLSIRALPKILSQYDKARLVLICEWPNQRRELESLSNQYGVRDFVIFVDRVDHSEIPRYYSVMDVLLMSRVPTRYFTASPLRPLEAMSMAKVVLGSDVDGLAEVIRHGVTGLLFAAGDVDDLARQCILLCRDEELRRKIGWKARTWVTRERTWTKVVDSYKSTYNLLIHKAAR